MLFPDALDIPTRLTLLARLADGDAAAWEDFWDTYSPAVYALAQRRGLHPERADQVAANVLATLYRQFCQQGKPPNLEGRSFRAWLRTFVRRRIADLWREEERRPRSLDETRDQPAGQPTHGAARRDIDPGEHMPEAGVYGPSLSGGPSDPSGGDECERALRLALTVRAFTLVGAAHPSWHQVFQLVRLDGQTPAAVAALLGITRNAVFISLCKFLKAVRETVAELWGDEAPAAPPGSSRPVSRCPDLAELECFVVGAPAANIAPHLEECPRCAACVLETPAVRRLTTQLEEVQRWSARNRAALDRLSTTGTTVGRALLRADDCCDAQSPPGPVSGSRTPCCGAGK